MYSTSIFSLFHRAVGHHVTRSRAGHQLVTLANDRSSSPPSFCHNFNDYSLLTKRQRINKANRPA